MPDNGSELLAQLVDKRLTEITSELKSLIQAVSQQLDAIRTATQTEVKMLEDRQRAIENAQRSISSIPASSLMSGRWPKRDGDTYSLKPQQLEPTAVAVHSPAKPEPDSADSPPGNLRSTNVG
jgi:hypothetical protein